MDIMAFVLNPVDTDFSVAVHSYAALNLLECFIESKFLRTYTASTCVPLAEKSSIGQILEQIESTQQNKGARIYSVE